jgi:hypothetical protein
MADHDKPEDFNLEENWEIKRSFPKGDIHNNYDCSGPFGASDGGEDPHWDGTNNRTQKNKDRLDIYAAGEGGSDPNSGDFSDSLTTRRGAAVGLSYKGVANAQQDGPGTASNHILTPNPMVSISATPRQSAQAYLGLTYDISLKGYIVPVAANPPDTVGNIFSAQRQLISVCNSNDLVLHLQTAKGNMGILSFPVKLKNISFPEGQYTNYGEYNISFESYVAISGNRDAVMLDGPHGGEAHRGNVFSFEDNLFDQYPADGPGDKLTGALLEDFTEDWSYSYETDFGMGQVVNSSNGAFIDSFDVTEGYYTVTRNIMAKGLDIFGRRQTEMGTTNTRMAWEYAHDAVNNYAGEKGAFTNMAVSSGLFPFSFNGTTLKDSTQKYEAFNFTTNTNINKTDGSVSLTQSWILLPSGAYEGNQSTSLEDYSTSISSEIDSGYISVSIEGTIKGLSKRGQMLSHNNIDNSEGVSGKFSGAVGTYTALSKSGQFGYCGFYKRAQAGVDSVLNTSPLSISVSRNTHLGEITYNISYDNRPSNFFRGVQRENIEVQDTYPGDLYTLVNVIGRNTGPVIQYGAGRTEYKRSLNLELQLSSYAAGDGRDRSIMYAKPSVSEAFRHDLGKLLSAVSPANEPGIVKYLADPPQETWNPTTGNYSLSLSWIYELSE